MIRTQTSYIINIESAVVTTNTKNEKLIKLDQKESVKISFGTAKDATTQTVIDANMHIHIIQKPILI